MKKECTAEEFGGITCDCEECTLFREAGEGILKEEYREEDFSNIFQCPDCGWHINQCECDGLGEREHN